MVGIISLLLVMYMLLFFTRIATIILVYTGMPEDIARFQSRSAVTGCGFTTAESEQITNNIIRRRVVGTLMLAGNVGIIASISSLLLSFVTVTKENYPLDLLLRLGMLAVGLALLWFISRTRRFEIATIFIFEFLTRTKMALSAYRLGSLCYLPDGYRVSELNLSKDSLLTGKSVADAADLLRSVRLLGLRHGTGPYIGMPQATEVFGAGDTVYVYGNQSDIQQLIRKDKARPAAIRRLLHQNK